jgi:hypothetical protein
LLLVAPLIAGSWHLTVSGTQALDNTSLSPPTTLSFDVTDVSNVTSLSAGATNDSPAEVIRKHLSQAMAGPNWDAVIEALGSGDDTNWDNARLAFDQLFKISASGKYLDRLAANGGLTRPVDVGMSDDIFRQLSIRLDTGKLTHESLREILEVFYGRDALRAWAETELGEPFDLEDGMTLTWTLDENQEIQATFNTLDFQDITAAKALEVAAVLTAAMRKAGCNGVAAVVTDAETGEQKIRLYSGSLGLKSFVRFTGGTAQPFLRFSQYLETYTNAVVSGDSYSWAYSSPRAGVTRLSLTTVGQPKINLSSVEAGDYVVVGFGVGSITRGSYEILDVSYTWSGGNLTQYFDVNADLGFSGNITQASSDDYRFFRPTKKTILSSDRTVVVAQTQRSTIDIRVPATTQAVNRGPHSGAYANAGVNLDVDLFTRNSLGEVRVTTVDNHNLAAGDLVWLDGFRAARSRPWITANVPGVLDYSGGSLGSCLTNLGGANLAEAGSVVRLRSGDLLFTGGNSIEDLLYLGESAACNTMSLLSQNSEILDGSEAQGVNRWGYQWNSAASMSAARVSHGVSLLSDDKPLVSGGYRLTTGFSAAAEKYDPVGNSWSAAASMSLARAGHRQLTLADSRVLVLGGAKSDGQATATAELYNPSTASWSSAASMSEPRYQHQALQLPDGRVMVTGGRTLGLAYESPTNVLAYWHFDESSGTAAATDSSGNGYDLTTTGTPVSQYYGKIGNCRQCLAAGSYLSRAGSGTPATAFQLDWTLEFWLPQVLLPGSGQSTIFAYASSSNAETSDHNALAQIGVTSGGRVFWRWEGGAGVDYTGTQTLGPALQNGGRYFIGLKKEFVSGWYHVSLFIDGEKVQTWTGVDNCTDGSACGWLMCREPESGGTDGYRGPVDEFLITTVARSDAQILSDYRRSAGWHYIPYISTDFGGNCLDTLEFYDPALNTWTQGPRMAKARSGHRMATLADGRILVYGGMGYDRTAAAETYDSDWKAYWPSQPLFETEIFDPVASRWYPGPRMPVGYLEPLGVYLPDSDRVWLGSGLAVFGGNIPYGTSNQIPWADSRAIWILDAGKMSWKQSLARFDYNRTAAYLLHSDVLVAAGGNDGATTLPDADMWVPGAEALGSAGLNGWHRVSAVPTAKTFEVLTPDFKLAACNFGDPDHSGGDVASSEATYKYKVTLGARTSGIVTLELSGNPRLHFDVGDRMMLNSGSSDFPSGRYVLTDVYDTAVKYTDGGTLVHPPVFFRGAVTKEEYPGAAVTVTGARTMPSGAPGPYIFDPDAGLSVSGTQSTLTTALRLGAPVDRLVVASTADFPDSQGYVVLGFGTSTQSQPIKYLEKLGSDVLLLEYGQRIPSDYPLGSVVTLLTSRQPWVPDRPADVGNFYATGSSAGRVAAQALTTTAAAAGMVLDFQVVYPGDRGLGAEGESTTGTQKLSDSAWVWGGDEE